MRNNIMYKTLRNSLLRLVIYGKYTNEGNFLYN